MLRLTPVRQQSSASVVDRFWEWCAGAGISSKRLSIRTVGSVCDRGLFLDESVKAGSVVASIPYKACINRELMGTRSVYLPSVPLVATALRRTHLDAAAAEHLWLTAFVATINAQTMFPQLQPFVDMFPHTLTMELQRRAAREQLSPQERGELHEIESCAASNVQLIRAFVGRYARLAHRCRGGRVGQGHRHNASYGAVIRRCLKDEARFAHAHDLVVSRAIDVPWGCRASSPRDLLSFLESDPSVKTIPTFVPLLDMVNAASTHHASSSLPQFSPSNCEVLTCVASEFVHDGTRKKRKVFSSPATRLHRMRIVICATRDIAADEELLMDYNMDEDRPAGAFRFGFVPKGK